MPGAFHERPPAPEAHAVDARLLQPMLGQGPEANDVQADSPMVFSAATRVWVEHAETEQKAQSYQKTHGSTIEDRLD